MHTECRGDYACVHVLEIRGLAVNESGFQMSPAKLDPVLGVHASGFSFQGEIDIYSSVALYSCWNRQ